MGRAGSLSRLLARGGGPRRRSNGTLAGPLRKIVARPRNEHGVEMETLECGHTIRVKRDLMGPTNAVRRRCPTCKKEADQ